MEITASRKAWALLLFHLAGSFSEPEFFNSGSAGELSEECVRAAELSSGMSGGPE